MEVTEEKKIKPKINETEGKTILTLNDTMTKDIDDKVVMFFRSNIEWLAAGESVFTVAKIVYMKNQFNMVPSAYSNLSPKFSAAAILVLDDVEKNHVYYWATPYYFPAVKIIYLNSDPSEALWFHEWSDKVEIRYICDQAYPANRIVKLRKEAENYDGVDNLPSLVPITREEFARAIGLFLLLE